MNIKNKMKSKNYFRENQIIFDNQKSTNELIIKIFWVLILIQFPIGFLLSSYRFVIAGPMIFLVNAIILVPIIIFIYYLIRKNVSFEKIKYLLMIFLVIYFGILCYTYNVDMTIHALWFFPITVCTLYFDRKLTIFTIFASIFMMVLVTVISPVLYNSAHFINYSFTIGLILLITFIANYFVSVRAHNLFSTYKNLDNTTNIIIDGTNFLNHALKSELSKINFCSQLLLESIKQNTH